MKSSIYIIYLVIVLSAMMIDCGGSNLKPTQNEEEQAEAQTLTISGWVEYEQENYNAAIQLFNDAKKANVQYLDAYNGLGWSYFRIHNLILSLFNFRIPIDADSTLIDVQVGYSIAAFEKNEYQESIISILTVIELDSTQFNLKGTDEYFFIHDTDVTSREVRKILALSYYYSGMFDEAYFQLIYFLDPLTRVNPTSKNYLMELLAALEKI